MYHTVIWRNKSLISYHPDSLPNTSYRLCTDQTIVAGRVKQVSKIPSSPTVWGSLSQKTSCLLSCFHHGLLLAAGSRVGWTLLGGTIPVLPSSTGTGWSCQWHWSDSTLHTETAIGRFGEAGLHEWMPFVIFRARSRERSQRHFRADCFTVCITVEVEPRTAKQYKCQYCCSCKNYRGKGMEGVGGWGGGECLCVVFWLARRSRVRGGKKCFGASYSTSNKLLLVARRILTTGLQKCLLKLAV